jgi:hypothetical protein
VFRETVPAVNRRATLLGLTIALAGCGPSTPSLLPAYGQLAAGGRETAWARAQAALRDRDEEIALADPQRGVLVTREKVRQAPCAVGACHARDVLHLRIDEGRAAVTLERRMFNPAAAAWGPPADPTAIAAVVAEERALLEKLQASRVEVRAGHVGEGCSATPDCAEGLHCVSRRCVKTREVR